MVFAQNQLKRFAKSCDITEDEAASSLIEWISWLPDSVSGGALAVRPAVTKIICSVSDGPCLMKVKQRIMVAKLETIAIRSSKRRLANHDSGCCLQRDASALALSTSH